MGELDQHEPPAGKYAQEQVAANLSKNLPDVRMAMLFRDIQACDEVHRRPLCRLAAVLLGPSESLLQRFADLQSEPLTIDQIFARIAYAYGLSEEEAGMLRQEHTNFTQVLRLPWSDLIASEWTELIQVANAINTAHGRPESVLARWESLTTDSSSEELSDIVV